VVDDAVHHRVVREESDEFHLAAAMRAEHRVDLINLPDHLSPVLARDAPQLVLDNPERKSCQARLIDLPPMGIGVEARLC